MGFPRNVIVRCGRKRDAFAERKTVNKRHVNRHPRIITHAMVNFTCQVDGHRWRMFNLTVVKQRCDH